MAIKQEKSYVVYTCQATAGFLLTLFRTPRHGMAARDSTRPDERARAGKVGLVSLARFKQVGQPCLAPNTPDHSSLRATPHQHLPEWQGETRRWMIARRRQRYLSPCNPKATRSVNTWRIDGRACNVQIKSTAASQSHRIYPEHRHGHPSR